MAFIRDAVVNAERAIARAESNSFSGPDNVQISLEDLQALLEAAQQAQRLMTYTTNDGEEKVVVVRGFGRDYARAMNVIRRHMGPSRT